jgi:hypothetical protein
MRVLTSLSLVTLLACGGGGTTATSPSPSPKVATEAEMGAAFLTGAEVGPGFAGDPPAKKAAGVTTAAKPVCGVTLPDAEVELSVFLVNSDKTRQVYERIERFVPGQAGTYIDARRRQGEARCEYDETVGKATYHVKVEGPVVDFPSFGDASGAYSFTYTGGFVGRRYAMFARIGLAIIYIEQTSKTLDPAFAIEVFRKAVEKAKTLR